MKTETSSVFPFQSSSLELPVQHTQKIQQMFLWFMGVRGEPGQGTRWQNQGISFPNTLLWGKKKGRREQKKGGGINHSKEKANYFSLPYKWNSRTNSQEVPSRASGSAGPTTPIQKAGAELETCCEHGGSTQRFLPAHYTGSRSLTSPSEPEYRGYPHALMWIKGASRQAEVWDLARTKSPSSCRKCLRAFNSPKSPALFLPQKTPPSNTETFQWCPWAWEGHRIPNYPSEPLQNLSLPTGLAGHLCSQGKFFGDG